MRPGPPPPPAGPADLRLSCQHPTARTPRLEYLCSLFALQCGPDLAVLGSVPEVSEIGKLITGGCWGGAGGGKSGHSCRRRRRRCRRCHCCCPLLAHAGTRSRNALPCWQASGCRSPRSDTCRPALLAPTLPPPAGLKVLPDGVPANATFFLPNNDAVAAFLKALPLPVSTTAGPAAGGVGGRAPPCARASLHAPGAPRRPAAAPRGPGASPGASRACRPTPAPSCYSPPLLPPPPASRSPSTRCWPPTRPWAPSPSPSSCRCVAAAAREQQCAAAARWRGVPRRPRRAGRAAPRLAAGSPAAPPQRQRPAGAAVPRGPAARGCRLLPGSVTPGVPARPTTSCPSGAAVPRGPRRRGGGRGGAAHLPGGPGPQGGWPCRRLVAVSVLCRAAAPPFLLLPALPAGRDLEVGALPAAHRSPLLPPWPAGPNLWAAAPDALMHARPEATRELTARVPTLSPPPTHPPTHPSRRPARSAAR